MVALLHPSAHSLSFNINTTSNKTVGIGDAGNAAATEANSQVLWRTAGTFSKMYCRVSANTLTLATATVRFRKNTANGNQTFSIAAGATGEFQDVTNTDSVVAGDKVSYQITIPNTGANSLTIESYAVLFAATAGTIARLVLATSATYAAANTTAWDALAGIQTPASPETLSQYKNRMPGQLRNLQALISANARTDTFTIQTRKNTANGNQILSIGAGTTGFFEDTVNTDSVISGDLINYQKISGASTNNITVQNLSVEFSGANPTSLLVSSTVGGPTSIATSTTTYFHPTRLIAVATEAFTQVKTNITYIAQFFTVRISSNGITATSTFRFRKNAGNGNQIISVGSGQTGYFEDVQNTDTLISTDEINYQIVSGGTGTTIAIVIMGHTVNTKVTPTAAQQSNSQWSYPI